MTSRRFASIDEAIHAVLDFASMESFTSAPAQAKAKRIWRRLFTEVASFRGGIPVVGTSPWLDEFDGRGDTAGLNLEYLQQEVRRLLGAFAGPEDELTVPLIHIDRADFMMLSVRRWNKLSSEARDGAPKAAVETAVILVLQCDKHPDDAALYLVVRLLERLGLDRLRVCGSVNRGVPCSRLFLRTGRKAYCSTTCQQRENQRRHRA